MGYHTFRYIKMGEGISIYVKSYLTLLKKVIVLSIINDILETCIVSIQSNNFSFNIAEIYCPSPPPIKAKFFI